MNFIEDDKPIKLRKKIKRESSVMVKELENKVKTENLNNWVKENVDSLKDSEIIPKIESEQNKKDESPPQ
jgi:hypothetical protein